MLNKKKSNLRPYLSSMIGLLFFFLLLGSLSEQYTSVSLGATSSTDIAHQEQAIGCSMSGFISSDTTWSPNDCNPYIVTGNLIVNEGVTLTIEAGTTIKFNSHKAMTIQGTLLAQGTADNLITFTSNQSQPQAGDWDYIYFTPTNTDSVIQYAIIEYAGGSSLTSNNGAVRIEGSDTVLTAPLIDHNTIRYNNATAVFVWNGYDHIQITNNTITNNTSTSDIGGLYVRSDTQATVTDNTISNNTGSYGGLYVSGGEATVTDNTISNNSGSGGTGGLYVDGGNEATITDNTISNNSGYYGGGLYVHGYEATITGNTITENSASDSGGGLYVAYHSIYTISQNTIRDNISADKGGGIAVEGWSAASGLISDNLIISNEAEQGGGIYLSNGSLPVINYNDIYENSANNEQGDALYNANLNTRARVPLSNVNAENNCWGTEDENLIEEMVWHFLDDASLSLVDYVPFTSPCDNPPSTPTSGPSNTPTRTSTPTNTPTSGPSNTPTRTSTPNNTPTSGPSNTPTNTPTVSATPTSLIGFELIAVAPNEGMSNQTTNVTITGSGFVATAGVQLQNDGTSYDLLNVSFVSGTQLLATVPAKLPPALYDLIVTNANGSTAILPNAFTILASEPMIIDVVPNRGLNNLPNEITLYGFNYAVGASVMISNTELATTRINGTQLRALIPADLLVPGSYAITVTNPGGLQAELNDAYTVFDDEENDDLFSTSDELWVSPMVPRAGENASIGLLVHRQGGRTALSNVRVRFFRDSQDGTVLGDGTIPFLDPANDIDSTIPLEITFPEVGSYELIAVIDPDNEVVEDSLGETNNVITRTVTIAEANSDETVPVVNDIVINDGATETTEQNVTVAIEASDPAPNASGMQAVNIIEYEYNLSAAQWIPIQQSSWLDYNSTPNNYGWQLHPSAGMRYLQVRALDNASNISIGNARKLINYQPAIDSVLRRQTRIYRYTVETGQQLEAFVEVLKGDPDLYVWSSNTAESARVSNNEEGNEQVIVPAEEIVPGVYQIEVYGYSDAQYRLEVTIGAASRHTSTSGQQTNGNKAEPSSPVIPVSSIPSDQQGVPPAPISSPTTNYQLYLPAITR